MFSLMMNTLCSKHVVDTKNWIKTSTQEMSQGKAPHYYVQKNYVIPNYERFGSFEKLHSLQVSIHKRFIRAKQQT
jgi:hypothetical protein